MAKTSLQQWKLGSRSAGDPRFHGICQARRYIAALYYSAPGAQPIFPSALARSWLSAIFTPSYVARSLHRTKTTRFSHVPHLVLLTRHKTTVIAAVHGFGNRISFLLVSQALGSVAQVLGKTGRVSATARGVVVQPNRRKWQIEGLPQRKQSRIRIAFYRRPPRGS